MVLLTPPTSPCIGAAEAGLFRPEERSRNMASEALSAARPVLKISNLSPHPGCWPSSVTFLGSASTPPPGSAARPPGDLTLEKDRSILRYLLSSSAVASSPLEWARPKIAITNLSTLGSTVSFSEGYLNRLMATSRETSLAQETHRSAPPDTISGTSLPSRSTSKRWRAARRGRRTLSSSPPPRQMPLRSTKFLTLCTGLVARKSVSQA
mmetsp:Transcript_118/g.491  ORF Transcript_118/g.491 Transcript_118/m.491 type:complete len:209 (+) Transcript_118:184-810(+)